MTNYLASYQPRTYRRLRAEQTYLLQRLNLFACENGITAWARPKDLGAYGSATRTSERLRGLVCRGLAEKVDAAPGGWREKPISRYRITAAGREELLKAADPDRC